MVNSRILVVDDLPELREILSEVLTEKGYSVETAGTGNEMIEKIEAAPFQAYIIDFHLPHVRGLGLIEWLKLRGELAKTIVISGNQDPSMVERIIAMGAFSCVPKPFEINEVLIKVKQILQFSEKPILSLEEEK